MSISKSDIVTIVLAVLFISIMSCPLTNHQGADFSTQNVDSLEKQWYLKQLESYPYDHSKIPTDDSNPTIQSSRR